jgi:hypothetical protein
MRHFRFKAAFWVVCLLTMMMLCGLTACIREDLPDGDTTDADVTHGANGTVADPEVETSTDTASVTEEPSEAATSEADTPEETQPALWEPDTGVFNEGKVTYETVISTVELETLSDELVGSVLTPDTPGVSVVLNTDFEGDDPLLGGDAIAKDAGAVGVVDGRLCIPYVSGSASNPDGSKGWNTWSHTAAVDFSHSKQIQLSMDVAFGAVNPQAWSGGLIGCYVKDYATHIPAWGGGDGLWFGFNPLSDIVTVYTADEGSWPAGLIHYTVPNGLLDGKIHMDIVCEADFTTTVFVTPENGEPTALVKVIFAEGNMQVLDHNGTKIAEQASTTKALEGGHFVFFPHDFGTMAIDSLLLLTGSAVRTREMTEIKATPIGENTLGLDITDKQGLVSMCYSVWHDAIHGLGDDPIDSYYNIPDILAGKQEWGPESVFHYWSKPAQGYYRASDQDAIRRNMTMLYNAGVDFINVDLTHVDDTYVGSGTNWIIYLQSPLEALLDTIMVMRSEGLGTPYVVLWYGDSQGPLCEALYEHFYSVEKWQDCFVYWEGKPLILTREADRSHFPMPEAFTVRSMWGMLSSHPTGQWSCMNINNQGTVSRGPDGKAEQIAVVPACQETYMSEPTAHGRNHGIMWYTQWHYAFQMRPKIVGVAWWNEWAAQRLLVNGKYIFTDTYNQEYSRDIEPMEGGHGSQYYDWLCEYIAYYKADLPCPVLVEDGYEEEALNAVS